MAEFKIEIISYKCDRCGHRWIPREKEKPTICPKCKSPYWNKPRKNKKEKRK
jgi:predicted Zn-ribbon and HTH transcriptional regulator